MHAHLSLPRPRAHVGTLVGLAARLADWLRNRAQRRELLGLDDRTLADLGLRRGDVERELVRPFWQPVDVAALELARRQAGPHVG